MNRSEIRAIELEYDDEVTGVRLRVVPEPEVGEPEEAPEDPRDALHRRILGALNRSRIMPYAAASRAAKEYSQLCREYRRTYGNLTISTSLPLHLVRRPAM